MPGTGPGMTEENMRRHGVPPGDGPLAYSHFFHLKIQYGTIAAASIVISA